MHPGASKRSKAVLDTMHMSSAAREHLQKLA